MATTDQNRYIIFGAGAVGCAIGGLLVNAGKRVAFVARPGIASALQTGLLLRHGQQELRVKAPAHTRASELTPEPGDVILLTVKSQSTGAAIQELAEVFDRATPVVCFQNAVRNEEIAERRFDHVYAGLVLLTAVQLEPGVVTIALGSTLAVGCFPAGVDRLARLLAGDLEQAGFEAIASAHVMAMKWGKLIANLNNATHAITGYWLERALAEAEMRQLMLVVREEGLRVLEAAGIEVEPPEGEPSPIRIRQMTEDLRKPPPVQREREPELPEDRRTYPSSWQDLFHKRPTNEADCLNGEIVRLGRQFGVPTPYNAALLRIVNRMTAEGLKPGLYTPKELHKLIAEQSC